MKTLQGLIKRTAFLIVFFGFVGFGLFLLSIGVGFLEIDDALTQLYAVSPDLDLSLFTAVGVAIMISSSFIFLLFAWFSRFDYVEIPFGAISRVIVQDLVIIVIDGRIFKKTSVEWARVNLNHVGREGGRNFFGIPPYDHELYIKDIGKLPLRTEELVPAPEETIQELDLADLEMMLDKDNETPFELGTEEEKDDADKKEVQTEILQ